ncbi:unknown [Clostridium sp. CAG:306]|jgi:hypothetical protein|nr:unknown [Clostridium sp. CAG:306]
MTTLDRIAQIKKSLCSDFQKLDRIVNKVKKEKNIQEIIALLRLYNFFDKKLNNFDKKLSDF